MSGFISLELSDIQQDNTSKHCPTKDHLTNKFNCGVVWCEKLCIFALKILHMTLKYTRVFVAAVLFITSAFSAFSQATLSRLEEDVTRAGCIYHSYEFSEIRDIKAPKGYEPFYISHYGRHGSRYHYTYEYLGSLDKHLHQADSLDNLTEDGKILLAQVDSILLEHKDMLGNLTAKGQKEIRIMSQRMVERFPEVFNDKDRNLIDAYSSIVRRCVVSMAVAASAILQYNHDLDVTFNVNDIVFNKFMNIGHHTRAGKAYYDPRMSERIKNIGWESLSAKIFKNPSIAGGTSYEHADNLWNYWSICQCLDTVNIDILKYFTMDQLLQYWQIKSGYYYLIFLRSDQFGEKNPEGMAPLMMEFIERADEAIAGNNVAATLRYGHDSTLMPFAAALGIADFAKTHSEDDLPIDYWDLASKIGMSSNVQIVFYKNRKNDILVKFLYNEKETTVPALEADYNGVYYSWNKVREYYLSNIK